MNGTVTTVRAHWRAAVLAAFVAELVFLLMIVLVRALRGLDPWTPVRVTGAFFLGPDAVQPPGFVAGDVALGAVVHAAFALAVGLLFAGLLPRLGLSPLQGGLLAGSLLYLFGFWILPLAFPERLSPFWLPPAGRAMQAVVHAVYGLVLGAVFARLAPPGSRARGPADVPDS